MQCHLSTLEAQLGSGQFFVSGGGYFKKVILIHTVIHTQMGRSQLVPMNLNSFEG